MCWRSRHGLTWLVLCPRPYQAIVNMSAGPVFSPAVCCPVPDCWKNSIFCSFRVETFFFFFFGHTCSMMKFPGQCQGLNLCHSSDPSHSGDSARSLTHWAIREFWDFQLLMAVGHGLLSATGGHCQVLAKLPQYWALISQNKQSLI